MVILQVITAFLLKIKSDTNFNFILNNAILHISKFLH